MMMRVIKRYCDKYTHEIVEVGTELPDLSDERKKELLAAGCIEPSEQEAEPIKPVRKTKAK